MIARFMAAACASFALLALSTSAACTEDTVVLASIPADDAGGPPLTPSRCASKSDCDDGAYCAKDACDAPTGTCTPLPTICSGDAAPVCGCDHVTYFNDCLRQAASQSFSTQGDCGQSSIQCGGPDHHACDSGQTCALLLGPQTHQCGPEAPGHCWVLPAACPASSTDTNRWVPCEPPSQGAPPPPCIDTCSAIRSGTPSVRAFQCQ